MRTIVTHNGSFHTDDVFAVATAILAHLNEEIKIVRTRDEELIQTADLVIDVGGIYDPKRHCFDHHQEGGAGLRDNGIPFASFGLVWKEYGYSICKENERIFQKIDKELIMPIDAHDNGVTIVTNLYKDLYPYTIGRFISSFEPPFTKDEEELYQSFLMVVDLAKGLLEREIFRATEIIRLEGFVENEYERLKDKRIIILEENYPWREVLDKYKEPLFVVYPRSNGWAVRSIGVEKGSFKMRKALPSSWAGKRNKELVELSGVTDAIFCHNGRFLAVAQSKEGAIRLAKIALD